MPVNIQPEPGTIVDVNVVSGGGGGGSTGGLTDTQLRATPVPVSGTVTVNTGLTDAQLRATAVPVSGPATDAQLRATALPVSLASVPSHAVTGPLTNTELRATAVPVSGTVSVNVGLTDTQLRATPVPVSGTLTVNTGLTDTQLRANPVPISGTVSTGLTQPATDAQLRATPLPVSGTVTATGPLTDTQLRASAVPVSGPLTQAQLLTQSSTLWVTATAAVNTGSTCTLPAAGAGLFHYITSIELVKLYNVVGVASGSGVVVTSTNLPGSPAWTTEQLASAAGTAVKVVSVQPGMPIRSSVANTATTFVAPAQLQTIWRWNVTYYTGP